jgi:hypothetical protein
VLPVKIVFTAPAASQTGITIFTDFEVQGGNSG